MNQSNHDAPIHQRFAKILGVMLAAMPMLVEWAGGQDTVNLESGKTQIVTITSEDYDGIWYALEKGQSRIRWKDVTSIQFGNAHDYDQAVEAFNSGRMDEALPQLQKLAADTRLRPVLRHGVLYYLALAYQRGGQVDQSIASYRELLKAFPKSRYLMTVGTNLLAAHLAKGDTAGAAKALDDFLAGAKAAGVEAGMQSELGLLRARILESQGKFPEALALYQGVQPGANGDPDPSLPARLGVGRCYQATGKLAEAEQIYRTLTTVENAPNNVVAGAWNGLADLALEVGTQRRSLGHLRDAMLCYMRGLVQYLPSTEESTEEYERSLAGSAKAFQSIGELESDATRRALFLERAKLGREQLKSQFPSSRYLKKN